MRGLVAVLALFLFLTGCGSDDGGAEVDAEGASDDGEVSDDGEASDAAFPPQNPVVKRPTEFEDLTGQASVEVEVADNVYRTRNFIVDPGTEIVFVNVGANPHNVVPSAEGAFEQITKEALDEGPATLVLDQPGDYAFFCSIHGGPNWGQTGFVVVAGA